MFGNNMRNFLPIILVSVFTSLFAICGLSVNVSAQGGPEFLVGNVSLSSNMTAAQIEETKDKVANYTNNIKEKAKGNLTKMSLLTIDDLLGRKLINEKDKQELVSFVTKLNQIKPTGNLTIADRDVSSALENLSSNSSNPIIVTLKETLKKKTGPVPGIPGLPPLTIGGDIDSQRRGVALLTCGLWGAAMYGPVGGFNAIYTCDTIIQ
jgi:hypothetical protein